MRLTKLSDTELKSLLEAVWGGGERGGEECVKEERPLESGGRDFARGGGGKWEGKGGK